MDILPYAVYGNTQKCSSISKLLHNNTEKKEFLAVSLQFNFPFRNNFSYSLIDTMKKWGNPHKSGHKEREMEKLHSFSCSL